MLPDSMQNAKMYGVEIDKVSAGIAQQLYQKISIAAQPFEEANIPDSFFDVIVGNEAVICGLTPEKARNIKEFAT